MSSRHFGLVLKTVKAAVRLGTAVNNRFGANTMQKVTKAIRKLVPSFPLWSPQLTAARATGPKDMPVLDAPTRVVYFASCISRVMGDRQSPGAGIMDRFVSLSQKVGIGVIMAGRSGRHCCGQIYSSKGFSEAHAHMVNATISELWNCSNQEPTPLCWILLPVPIPYCIAGPLCRKRIRQNSTI